MTDITLALNATADSVDGVKSLYASPSNQSTKIKAFTVSNNQEESRSYLAYIYSSGGEGEPIIPTTLIAREFVDHAAGAIGHIIPAGGTLRISASATDLVFNVTGELL